MLLGPFENQGQGSPRHLAFQDVERSDVDEHLVLGIKRVKMRRRGIAPEHLNPDCPLGVPAGLRAPWRPDRGHFGRLLVGHSPRYGLLATARTASRSVSPSSRVLMDNLG